MRIATTLSTNRQNHFAALNFAQDTTIRIFSVRCHFEGETSRTLFLFELEKRVSYQNIPIGVRRHFATNNQTILIRLKTIKSISQQSNISKEIQKVKIRC